MGWARARADTFCQLKYKGELMLIYIIRHGQAHNGSHTGRDQDRTLTERGHQQAKAVGMYLKACEQQPVCVIASPFVRAQETASDICAVLDQSIIADDRLGADRGLTEMLAVLEDHRDKEALAIVSHMPTVGQLESLLSIGPTASESSFWTGEAVTIRVDGDELIGGGEMVDRYRLAD